MGAPDSEGVTITEVLLPPTLAAIHERRSVRSYRSDPVDRSTIERLLDAAVWAPSAMNAQPWAFVVVQDPDLLASLEVDAAAVFLQEPPPGALADRPREQIDQLRELVRAPGFGILHGAPALIVIYATSAAGVPDCYLAAENLLLAATTLGLGTCPIGLAQPLLDQPAVKAEFGVPADYPCALPIVVGFPSAVGAPPPRETPRVLAWR